MKINKNSLLTELNWRFQLSEEEASFIVDHVIDYINKVEVELPLTNINDIIEIIQTLIAKVNSHMS